MSMPVSVNGKCYESIRAVTRALKVPYSSILKYRKQYKISCAQAIELVIARNHKAKDHLGQTFKSTLEMCRAHGVTYDQFLYRVNKGCSIAECLNSHSNRTRNTPAVDHYGNAYKSISEMCRHYGVLKNTFSTRLSRGWSIRESLTGKREKKHDENISERNR